MGFYHYLKVKKHDDKLVDVGGYSKGGSHIHWTLAFESNEYQENLKEIVKKNDFDGLKVGFETTVEKAMERLEKARKEMEKFIVKPCTYKEYRKIQRCINGINELTGQLYFCEHNELLILNQNGGCEYAIKYDENNNMIGIEDWWHQYGTMKNEEIIGKLKPTPINLSEMIEDVSKHLDDKEIDDFNDALRLYVAESDRGWGPTLVSDYVDKNQIGSNNPRFIYKTIMNEIVKRFEEEQKNPIEEDDDLPFFSPLDEREVIEGSHILIDFIEGTMEDMRKYKC